MRARPIASVLTTAISLALMAAPAIAQSDLEQRVNRIEQRLEGSALMGLMNQAETLRGEVTTLRGEIEMLQRQIDNLRDQQRQLYLDTDSRLQQLEQSGVTSGNQAPATGEEMPAAGATSTTESADTGAESDLANGTTEPDADDPAQIQAAYDAAFATLRAGRYAEAAGDFEQFLTDYPDVPLAANARYWLGESYYVVRDFDNALEHFSRVITDHPESNKRPDALLKIGYVHFEQGNMEEARVRLEQVISEFPESTAANLARQRLDQI